MGSVQVSTDEPVVTRTTPVYDVAIARASSRDCGPWSGEVVNVVDFIFGLLIVVITITGILFVLVLPRQPFGIERLTLMVNRMVRLVFVGLSRLATTYERKDAILAPTAPVALLGQILFWAVSLIVGFGIMLIPTTHSLWLGLEEALTALFTVGTIHDGGTANVGIDIWAGATWVIVVALQIAYLPTLY